MNLAQQYGIYLIADLSAPVVGQSINRDSPVWNTEIYARYTAVVDSLSKYTNVIGFFAGNEVANSPINTDSMPFVKAAVRDMKTYISSKNLGRSLYVGYATSDDQYTRNNIENYLNCGDTADTIDFLGYNIYEWCKSSDTFQTSGYQARTQDLAGYTVPAFFAEYGCNTNPPRLFADTLALYSSEMTDVWSGGLVYQYFQGGNNYGLYNLVENKSRQSLIRTRPRIRVRQLSQQDVRLWHLRFSNC